MLRQRAVEAGARALVWIDAFTILTEQPPEKFDQRRFAGTGFADDLQKREGRLAFAHLLGEERSEPVHRRNHAVGAKSAPHQLRPVLAIMARGRFDVHLPLA